jgi:hypothetical protein
MGDDRGILRDAPRRAEGTLGRARFPCRNGAVQQDTDATESPGSGLRGRRSSTSSE